MEKKVIRDAELAKEKARADLEAERLALIEKEYNEEEKKNTEWEKKLDKSERRIDHFERAKRLAEIPRLKEQRDAKFKENVEYLQSQFHMRVKREEEQHKVDLVMREKSKKMMSDKVCTRVYV